MDEELILEPGPEPAPMDGTHAGDPAMELEALRVALESREAELAAERDSNRVALERLRTAMMTIEPDLTPDMLAGDSVDELEASFAAAVETLGRIRERVRREQLLPVGAGAPGRSGAGPVTALEKIRQGLARA